jgi:hypothetical protein
VVQKSISAGVGTATTLSRDGKQEIAAAMYVKGKNFLGAAMLLRQKGGYEYVVLHLMCQGIEITLKAFLLFKDHMGTASYGSPPKCYLHLDFIIFDHSLRTS